MPCLTISASPDSNSRGDSVSVVAGSQITRRGWWKAPIRFFAVGWSIAVLPPIAASTWASTVVGSWTKLTPRMRSEEHTSELQSRLHLVCRLLLEKKKKKTCHKNELQTTSMIQSVLTEDV